jgi:hypothetical protein
MSNGSNSHLLSSLGLCGVLSAIVFVFAPATLYLGNVENFTTPLWVLLRYLAVPGVLLVLLLGLAGGVLVGSSYRRFSVVVATLSVLAWVQGNLLVWEYGPLNGLPIDWTEARWRGWADLVVWVAALGGAVVFHRRLDRPMVSAAVALFALQLLYTGYRVLDQREALARKPGPQHFEQALREMHRFSPQHNVLQIVLDGFQSDIFDGIVNRGPDSARYAEALEGFTFFQDHLGLFPTTYMTVPAILSGEVYRNHVPKRQFVASVIEGNTTLNAARAAGYEVDIAGDVQMNGMYTQGDHTNVYTIAGNHQVKAADYRLHDAARLMDLTLFRLSPHFLKQRVYNGQLWLVQASLSDSRIPNFPYFSHTAFLANVRQKMTADRSAPVYKLFHLMTTHAPFVANSDCDFAGRSLPVLRETVIAQSRCALWAVMELFNRMKELDIYEDALIIIMADHGAAVQPREIADMRIEGEDDPVIVNPYLLSVAAPLFAIKPPGASGAMRTSAAPTSIGDTAATIADVLDLDVKFPGRSVLEVNPGALRERSYYFYVWRLEHWNTEYMGPMREYAVRGPIFDSSSWRLAGELLSPAGGDGDDFEDPFYTTYWRIDEPRTASDDAGNR